MEIIPPLEEYKFKINLETLNVVFPRLPPSQQDTPDLSESQELTLHVFPPAVQVREIFILNIISKNDYQSTV